MIANTKLFKRIIDDRNIYRAIYSLESYIFERELLCEEDLLLFYQLGDKLNGKLVKKTIEAVKGRLYDILVCDDLFSFDVYFKPKDLNDDGKIKFRPIHTTGLYDQIAIVSMFQTLIFEVVDDKKMQLNHLGVALPPNFYGNIPSDNPRQLFVPWQEKYKAYSEEVHGAYTRFVETKEYSHEVSLDLKSFFPSLNPLLVYDFIVRKLSTVYIGNEFDCLKTVLFKLLCATVNIRPLAKEYYTFEVLPFSPPYFIKGIPQGLPHAYFFGNIGMVKVAEIYDKILGGQSYYYVDDSVIFCNLKNYGEMGAVLEKIQQELDELSGKLMDRERSLPSSKHCPPFIEYVEAVNFRLEVHPLGEKSSITEIGEEKLGQTYLNLMSKEASMGSFAVRTTFSDIEDITVMGKMKKIRESVEKEIERIDGLSEEGVENKNYKKQLVRFKKFFKFRERLLAYREGASGQANALKCFDVTNDKKELDVDKVKIFFENFNEDTFFQELLFQLRDNISPEKYKELKTSVEVFEKAIYEVLDDVVYEDIKDNNAYISKVIGSFDTGAHYLERSGHSYRSIKQHLERTMNGYIKSHRKNRIKALGDILREFSMEGIKSAYLPCDINLIEWVMTATDELKRTILNAVISRILNVEINDNCPTSRLDNRPLSSDEFRILTYIRNPNCDVNDFYRFANERISCADPNGLDLTVIEIANYFRTFVADPKLIDVLIQVHNYTSAVWKNGSKHLHFYTLHNQEHAVELIKAVVNITKSVTHFQLSRSDYYVLFIACYLHDISMALHPDLQRVFLDSSNIEGNLLASSFRQKLVEQHDAIPTNELPVFKNLLLSYYKRLDSFFESYTRNHHAERSAEFVRLAPDLEFLDANIRDLVSEVSEAHLYDVSDIYRIRPKGDSYTINKKYVKAILRLADVLDMADDRISAPIFTHNQSHMGETTQFHWLSHRSVAGYELSSTYSNTMLGCEGDARESYLGMGNFKEHVQLTILLNSWHDELSPKDRACTDKKLKDIDGKVYELEIGKNYNSRCAENCRFMCNWMSSKHFYLFQELHALQEYLDRCESNYFQTEITVKLKASENANPLPTGDYHLISRAISPLERDVWCDDSDDIFVCTLS